MDEREERLFQLLEKTMDMHNQNLKTNTELVSKISKSFDDVMIMVDKRSEKRDASNDKHINEWKWALILSIVAVTLSFVGIVWIYFFSPWESCAISNSESSSTITTENINTNSNTNSNINTNENSNYNKEE